jgi:hypothetical protein
MKNKIYIASDHTKRPIGLVLASSEEVAWAFFHGRGDKITDVEEIDPMHECCQDQSLVVLLTSKECKVVSHSAFAKEDIKYRDWKRGN